MRETNSMQDVYRRIEDIHAKWTDPKFTFDRNGLRLAIASLEDETGELYDEWKHSKNHLGNALHEIRHELLDIAAVALITYENTWQDISLSGHGTEKR